MHACSLHPALSISLSHRPPPLQPCRYVALTNIFGGSCEINPTTVGEYYVQAVMMLCGSCVWAYVIGSCCGILATLNPALIEYRQTIDELNVFVRDHDMPQDLTVRLRSYFRNTMHLIRTRRYEQLLAKMSKRLRGDSSLVVATRAFKRVSYLSHPDLEPEFLCNLTIRFKLAVYSRLERISTTHLFLVDRGVCAKKGKIALVGACLGEDMIITNPHLRDVSDAIALTFVQTVFLTREAIFELLPEFPRAYRVIRRAAYRFALRRFIVQAAEEGMKAAGRAFGKGGIGAKQAMLDQINAEEEARSAAKLAASLAPAPAGSFKGFNAALAKACAPAPAGAPSSSTTTTECTGVLIAANVPIKDGGGGILRQNSKEGSPGSKAKSPFWAKLRKAHQATAAVNVKSRRVVVNIDEAIQALHARFDYAAANPPAQESANAFGLTPQIDLYSTNKSAPAGVASEELREELRSHSSEIASLKQQVSGVDKKIDMLAQQIGKALSSAAVAQRSRPLQRKKTEGVHGSGGGSKQLLVRGAPSAAAVANAEKAAAERDEIIAAEKANGNEPAATRSSPYDA